MIVNRKCRLMYKVEYEAEENESSFKEMQETLARIGVDIFLSKGYLILTKSDTAYKKETSRGAGRKGSAKPCSMIEVLQMLLTMTDKQICTKLQMSERTYYRHKKAMLQSDMYYSLDSERLNDIEYLQELEKDPDIREMMF